MSEITVEELSRRIDKLEKQFEQVDSKLDRVLELLSERHSSNSERIKVIESKLCSTPNMCSQQQSILMDHSSRLSTLEKSIAEIRGIGMGVRSVWFVIGGVIVSIISWILAHFGIHFGK